MLFTKYFYKPLLNLTNQLTNIKAYNYENFKNYMNFKSLNLIKEYGVKKGTFINWIFRLKFKIKYLLLVSV